MSEIIFLVEDASEGGYTARAVGESIYTEAETLDELHNRVRDAVRCHFDEGNVPKLIRLHFVRDEVIIAETTSEGLLLRPAVTLPIEIYSEKQIREFDEGEAELEKILRRKKKTKSAR